MISCAVFDKLNGAFPETKAACCIVLIVSNGANNNFEHPAARPLAKLFLKPLIHAASWDLLDEVDVEMCRIALLFESLPIPAPGPLRCLRYLGNKDGLLEFTIVLENMSVVNANTATK